VLYLKRQHLGNNRNALSVVIVTKIFIMKIYRTIERLTPDNIGKCAGMI